MHFPLRTLVAGTALLSSAAVVAVTSISDSAMNGLLDAGGVDLAVAAAPMFFFGQALNQPPCYPMAATNDAGAQTPAAGLCAWPNAGCGCRTPGVGIGNAGPSFPVYYSYSKCNDGEVRVVYNLFYEKDGFIPDVVFGHGYDWERVIVVWSKTDDSWAPSQLLLSQHSGYGRKEWSEIQNTFDTADAGLARGGDNGRQNLDHPKVYVAWGKHAAYDDRNTGWNGVIAQMTDNAFRSQDWWYFPKKSDYLRADGSTALGRLLSGYDWGHATSHPASVHDGLCDA